MNTISYKVTFKGVTFEVITIMWERHFFGFTALFSHLRNVCVVKIVCTCWNLTKSADFSLLISWCQRRASLPLLCMLEILAAPQSSCWAFSEFLCGWWCQRSGGGGGRIVRSHMVCTMSQEWQMHHCSWDVWRVKLVRFYFKKTTENKNLMVSHLKLTCFKDVIGKNFGTYASDTGCLWEGVPVFLEWEFSLKQQQKKIWNTCMQNLFSK